ncbi:MAG: response regulator [Nitrososphaeraceae archaeon]|jgi:two-component system response regulator HydG
MLFQHSIAVVEDEEDILTLFTEIIRENGYPVIGFTKPSSFVEYLRIHRDEIDLILIDYKLPQMTGCDLAKKIAEIDPRIKMILITAYNDIVNNTLNLELIRKPIKINELVQIINHYMHPTIG